MSSSTDQPAPPKSRCKRLAQNAALMLGTFLLCGVALEVVLRIAGYGNVELYEPDPVLYWKLKANQNCYTKIDRKPVRINSRGTRGPEFQVPKPPGVIRILSLGDSKTFGWGLSESEAYSGLTETLLQQQSGAGKKIEVINAGVNAWSFPQMRLYLRDVGLKFQPDLVVLADANLWTQFSEENSPEFVNSFLRRVRLKNFLRRFATYHYIVEYKLREVYEQTRSKFIPIDPKTDTLFREQQAKDPDAFFRKHIQGLCSLAFSNRVQPVLLYIPTLTALQSPGTNATLRAKTLVSQQLGVPLVDMTPDLNSQGKALYLDADPVHLNVVGNEIIARRLANTLINLLSL